VISPPYPNPADGTKSLEVDIQVPGTATVTWSVFTTAFRKVRGETTTISSYGSIQWDLRDQRGHRVAAGLYYLRVEIKGDFGSVRKIVKVIVLP
jgi:hypothetical protein